MFGWGLFILIGEDAVVVHGNLVEDLSQSLSELNDVLSANIYQKDPVYRAIVKDAQIFSFVRASEVVRRLIRDIHSENTEGEVVQDIETGVITLCMLDIFEDEQANSLLNHLDLAEILTLDRSWLESDEDRRVFDGGIQEIASFYANMCALLDEVSSHGTLIDYEEKNDFSH